MSDQGRVKITPAGARRMVAATEGWERLAKNGAPGGAATSTLFPAAVFLTTSTITAGTGTVTSPGFGTGTMQTGATPPTRANGKTGIKIWNDGKASIPTATLVYCLWMNGGWMVFWVLCP